MDRSPWISSLRRFIRSYKPEETQTRPAEQNLVYTAPQASAPLDGKTARLMELTGKAIDTWAAEYHLENLPRHIVFQQALDAMKAIDLMNRSGRG